MPQLSHQKCSKQKNHTWLLQRAHTWSGGQPTMRRPVEVCTGSKLKPEPGPYPRSSDPTWPTRAAQLNLEPEPDPKSPPPPRPTTNKKKKEKGCISRLHAKKRINQGSAISQTFTSYESLWTSGAAVAYLPCLWILYGQEDDDRANYGHFLSVKAR